jgi:hypothetical protein
VNKVALQYIDKYKNQASIRSPYSHNMLIFIEFLVTIHPPFNGNIRTLQTPQLALLHKLRSLATLASYAQKFVPDEIFIEKIKFR